MKKQLFFDDNSLFARDNTIRKYGKPVIAAEYNDGVCSTDYSTGQVFRLKNNKYRMLYFAHSKNFKGMKLFSAVSDDGTHFVPEKLWEHPGEKGKTYSHEIMELPECAEIAAIFEDIYCCEEERYKILMSEADYGKLTINDAVYVSGDLLNWKKKEGAFWGDGAEPLTSVFYNKNHKCYTICERPFWGIRRAGYKETQDWINYTEYRNCLNVDSLDERLAEIYGMYAFEYYGMYIGIPHIYRGLESELNAKYKNGIMDTQLAYSYDGRYWQRSLREPFISGLDSGYKMVWVSNAAVLDDGSVNFYCSASELEHGPAFHQPGTGNMLIYNMRSDGFIYLKSEDFGKPSAVATREKVWHGGEMHYNLKAKSATAAVYITDEDEIVAGNTLGFARPIEGYSHNDCIEFCGDSTDWIPVYKSGKKVDELKGKTLVFELKFNDGEIYSLSGDYTDVFNTQAARYRKFSVLPE